jgi:hypothetical protein
MIKKTIIFRNWRTGQELPAEKEFEIENVDGYIEPGKTRPKKKRKITISGFGIPFKVCAYAMRV